MKKGVLISISILLLILAVLTLSSTLTGKARSYADNSKYIGIIDRTAYKYENLGDNVLEIIMKTLNVTYDAEQEAFLISEPLSNKKGQQNLEDGLEQYKQFVDGYPDGFDININVGAIDDNELFFEPCDIAIWHDNQGKKKNENRLNFRVGDANCLRGYDINVLLNNQSFKQVVPSVQTASKGIDLNLHVYNCKGCDANNFLYSKVDENKVSIVIIETTGKAKKDLNIVVAPPNGSLAVANFNSVSVDLNVNVFLQPGVGIPQLVVPPDVISVYDSRFRVRKY